MADFNAIDALLASASPDRTPLPPAEERRRLREGLNLSRAQLAQALGVSASTVGGWESGREPGGEVREKYAYFLEGARTKLDAAAAAVGELGDGKPAEAEQTASQDDADVDVLPAPQPCVLCGQPARHHLRRAQDDRVEGPDCQTRRVRYLCSQTEPPDPAVFIRRTLGKSAHTAWAPWSELHPFEGVT